ncbi:MAG: DUF4332 domain-containing protein, partial [Chloroflexota bacterium]|nr:DUF4332 domain-containing protein [Chloroflexota bacterium]
MAPTTRTVLSDEELLWALRDGVRVAEEQLPFLAHPPANGRSGEKDTGVQLPGAESAETTAADRSLPPADQPSGIAQPARIYQAPSPDRLEEALEAFRIAVVTPEERIALAEKLEIPYEKLTNWAIRANLLTLEGVTPQHAELLTLAGVVGVRDLALREVDEPRWPSGPPRLDRLRAQLSQVIEETFGGNDALAEWVQGEELGRLVARAKRQSATAPELVATRELVLVVKGAGEQAPDATVDTFLQGLWPAVKQLDPKARLVRRQDVLPPDYLFNFDGDVRLGHLAEIQTGERRLWIKEAYWEKSFRLPTPIAALQAHWQMVVYAFGRMFYRLLSAEETDKQEHRALWRFVVALFLQYFFLLLFLLWTLWN